MKKCMVKNGSQREINMLVGELLQSEIDLLQKMFLDDRKEFINKIQSRGWTVESFVDFVCDLMDMKLAGVKV